MNFGRNSRGTNRNPRATADTVCQKCLKRGHFIYECKSVQPYKPRPSRTQMLEQKKPARDRPSVEVPEEFKKKSGLANKILEDKEKDREAKRKRSASPSSSSSSSSSSSDSDSDSDSSSSGSDSDSDSDSGSSRSGSRRDRSPKRVRRKRSVSPDESPRGKGKGRARSASVGSRASD